MLYQVAVNDEPVMTTGSKEDALAQYKAMCRDAKRGSVIYFLEKEDSDTLWGVESKYYAPGADHPVHFDFVGKNTFTNAI